MEFRAVPRPKPIHFDPEPAIFIHLPNSPKKAGLEDEAVERTRLLQIGISFRQRLLEIRRQGANREQKADCG